MKMLLPLGVVILAASSAAPVTAQKTAAAGTATTAARNVWRPVHDYVVKSAEQMPEGKYNFKATPDVRSFAQLIAHVAGSEYMFCAAALGEPARAENDIEKNPHTKAELVAAIKASGAYCERAYAISDAAGARKLKMFGDPSSALEVLILNAAHDDEHYGNIVTYLRLNGMVPPSSQPGQ